MLKSIIFIINKSELKEFRNKRFLLLLGLGCLRLLGLLNLLRLHLTHVVGVVPFAEVACCLLNWLLNRLYIK